MVFSRFFKGKEAAAPAAEEVEPEESADDAEQDGEDVAPEEFPDVSFAERAMRILPTGTSTGSKRPAALYGDADVPDAFGPTHFVRASGCRIETAEGMELLDCTMALGSVAIGYAEPRVTRAVLETVGGGSVSALPSVLELEVAERFCEFVPCAKKVQFLKTGAEGVAAAVRIARTYTGRDVVIGSGYFGWHDWNSTGWGIPSATQANFHSVPFDDVPALEAAVAAAGSKLAAIILEPVVERLPSVDWIARARSLCDANGAVLIFDEVKTGFRLAPAGYQDTSTIVPDLAVFGKALANGFPLSAVCGGEALMDAARKTWISSTLATESSALAAAYVVLDMHAEEKVCEKLAEIGREMRQRVDSAIESSGLDGVSTHGLDQMWFMRFDTPEKEARFLRTSARHGVLFKRGAYNFAALAHDEDALHDIEAAASTSFVEVRRALENA